MTITEVLVAGALLTFVVMTSLTALSQAHQYTRHARMLTLAGQIAQSAMEDLRLRNYMQLKNYAAQAQPVNLTSVLTTERFASAFTRGFGLTAQFTTLVASTPAQLGKISVSVTVTWVEQGTTFSRVVTTYFGEKGLSDYYYVGWATP